MPNVAGLTMPLEIKVKEINNASLVLRAIFHPVRLKIIQYLHSAGKLRVSALIKKLKMEQSVVSQHLRILKEQHILNAKKDGRSIYYSIHYEQVNKISKLSAQLVPRLIKEKSKIPPKASYVKKAKFNNRELIIIKLICKERTNLEIAEKLGFSSRTIEGYREIILQKMEVKNTAGLVVYAIRNNLFKV